MSRIAPMAERHGLHLVEDAAQAHAATLDGRCAGTWGIGCFSLYATKNITSGEGGLVTTDDDAIADRLRLLRNQGMRQRYQYERAGNNYRMTDLQAAVCLPQLPGYGANVERRRRHAATLNEALADLPWLQVPSQVAGRGHVWHQYTVLLSEDAPITRDQLIEHLAARGVGCGVYYPKTVLDYDCYRSSPSVVRDDVPIARSVAERCLSLPVHPRLDESALATVIAAVRSAGA
jgi:dTDP-4-amino-4,6-dideoxygalactose transaminase